MDMRSVEQKWQQKWNDKPYSFNYNNSAKKYYVLEMFAYPSGAKLHIGHWYNYAPSDSFARFKRMQGFEVFHPVGFDAFGLPAENYAIKTGIHPKDSTLANIATMEAQLKAMGAMYDFNTEIKTCEEDYYKWSQYLFLKLYDAGLAYQKEAPVNWCSSCNTTLANEQVDNGCCERCGTVVERKNLLQWFFKITKYSEELLKGLDELDWPEKTKLMQKNWIGKSFGGEIEFTTEGGEAFKVFTTRADTLFGVSYVVLAPEHPLVEKLTTKDKKKEVTDYLKACAKVSEIDRLSAVREKTGVFIGSYAINPINGKRVPVYIADYVLYSYGTGAVMGVPAHDERDFVFAKKYGLPIKRVIKGEAGKDDLPFTDDGTMVESPNFDGFSGDEARKAVINRLITLGKAEYKTNYRLRDWLVSRQRYWGTPIPVVHCKKCGIVPVPYKDLPVRLPYNVEFKPDGKSPLLKCEEFMNVKCPACGADAKREADTLDTFICSSWYFLRYIDSKNAKAPFDSALVNKIMPVDKYIGGAEHACMHLLYARFFTKVLKDLGMVNFDEPFKSLVHQGTILGADGEKMSKSKGNVVSPDKYIEEYGADVFRLYLMFGFSYIEGGPWNDDGIKSAARFLERVERLVLKVNSMKNNKSPAQDNKEILYLKNYTIKSVTQDMEKFSFNTAVARLMEYVNGLYKYVSEDKNTAFLKELIRDLILLLAPLTPHFCEELWEICGNKKSVFAAEYPRWDDAALVLDKVEVVIQINSKIKHKLILIRDLSESEIKNIINADEKVTSLLEGKEIKKLIVIPNKIINILI